MTVVSINKQARLSEHFTLAEMCKTSAKTADGNIPSHVHIENLKRLCGWLEMLRSEWNKRYGEGDDPIVINSGYRSEAVNKAVGGVSGSNHLTGCAADIRAPSCSTSATSPKRTSMNSCWSVRLAAATGSTSQ